ncbi:MAG: hypothetical protein WDO15_18355 [Bacteroidota bacterium]
MAINYLVSNYTSVQLLDECKKIQSVADRLHFLSIWLTENNEKEDPSDIIDYAVDQLIIQNNREYPGTEMLRSITHPLKRVKKQGAIKSILERLEFFDVTALKNGPMIAYFEYRLNLAQGAIVEEYNRAVSILNALDIQLKSIKELRTQLECSAILHQVLNSLASKIDRRYSFLQKTVGSLLSNNIKVILNETGDHYSVLSETIKIIGYDDPDRAIKIALAANTRIRRNRLLYSALQGYLKQEFKSIDIAKVNAIYSAMTADTTKEASLKRFLERAEREALTQTQTKTLMPIFQRLANVASLARPLLCIDDDAQDFVQASKCFQVLHYSNRKLVAGDV